MSRRLESVRGRGVVRSAAPLRLVGRLAFPPPRPGAVFNAERGRRKVERFQLGHGSGHRPAPLAVAQLGGERQRLACNRPRRHGARVRRHRPAHVHDPADAPVRIVEHRGAQPRGLGAGPRPRHPKDVAALAATVLAHGGHTSALPLGGGVTLRRQRRRRRFGVRRSNRSKNRPRLPSVTLRPPLRRPTAPALRFQRCNRSASNRAMYSRAAAAGAVRRKTRARSPMSQAVRCQRYRMTCHLPTRNPLRVARRGRKSAPRTLSRQ